VKHLVAIALFAAACGSKPPAPAKPVAPTPPPPPSANVELTTAEQVIEAALAQEGGREAAAKITSVHMTGTITIGALGVKGKLETFGAPPNLSFTHLEIPNLLTDDSGVKGDVAWEKNTMQGVRLLTGPEKSMALREATFNGDLVWKTLYPKADLKGIVKFAEQDCYQIELTATDGQKQTRYYTKKELLPIGLEMTAPSQMGDVPVKVISSDWREENGFKYPHKMTRNEAAQSVDVTIDKIETNTSIAPAKFELPDDVKQLLAAPATPTSKKSPATK
jgi:outer membrane lipoprotein-sorting protein